MLKEFFISQQEQAHKNLIKDGVLTHQTRTELCYFRKLNKDVPQEFQDMFNILFEVKIAESVADKWFKQACRPYNAMVKYIFDYAKLAIGNKKIISYKGEVLDYAKMGIGKKGMATYSREMCIIDNMMDFLSKVVTHDFNEVHQSIFLNCGELSNEEKEKSYSALSAIIASIIPIQGGGKFFEDHIPDDWVPDADYIDTADSASQATDLSLKEFWTWYIDVAFPQALAEVPKYLNRAEG